MNILVGYLGKNRLTRQYNSCHDDEDKIFTSLTTLISLEGWQ